LLRHQQQQLWDVRLLHPRGSSFRPLQALVVVATRIGEHWPESVHKRCSAVAALTCPAPSDHADTPLQSSLLATRIFVLSSFLDLFLFTLSLFSLLLLCTYPEIRSNLCELFSSGTLAAGTQLGVVGNEATQPGWLARVVEEIFAGEECDEAFARDVVPLLLVFSLLYTAVRCVLAGSIRRSGTSSPLIRRLYCFLTIHHFYMQLLRTRIHQYLPCSSSSSSGSSASSSGSAPRSSATSSRGSHDGLVSPTSICFPMVPRGLTVGAAAHGGKKAHPPRAASRVMTEINEKLA
jgi:hypothetical protein